MTYREATFYIQNRDYQRKWYADHGGCEAAYITRYGDKDDPKRYGNGGQAIYAADKRALDLAEENGTKADKILGLLL